ncbi:MAG TPA: hypothetical protein VIQ05_01400 [Tardiphaga sp.]
MKAFFTLAAVLLLWQIAVWTFAPPVAPPKTPAGDGKPYDANEKYDVDARISQRQDAFRALGQPTGSLCTEAGRKSFIGGLGHYYYHRQNQTERYPEIHGQLGADYIAKQFSSTDDKRIDRLTQELYSRGYLKPDDFEPVARRMIAVVVKGERITAKGCAG